MGRRQGFSIVELLVACGIIALLIGVVVPLAGAARERAKSAACASNLRQWGVALLNYTTDHNGFLPRRGQGVQPTNQITRPTDWFNALPASLELPTYMAMSAANDIPRPGGKPSFWICPSAQDRDGANYFAYGMNMALSVWESNQNGGKPNNMAAIGNPVTMVFLMDGPGNYCSVFPSITPGGYNPTPRHNNSINICFADGHVAAIAGDYVGVNKGLIEHSDVRWKPPGSTWNSAR